MGRNIGHDGSNMEENVERPAAGIVHLDPCPFDGHRAIIEEPTTKKARSESSSGQIG